MCHSLCVIIFYFWTITAVDFSLLLHVNAHSCGGVMISLNDNVIWPIGFVLSSKRNGAPPVDVNGYLFKVMVLGGH